MDPGCRKPQRGFWLPANTSDPDAILIVESAIDALYGLLVVPSRHPTQRPHQAGNVVNIS